MKTNKKSSKKPAVKALPEITANGISISQASKVLEVVDVGLCKGVGQPIPGQMCVEAAVCYALGQPHGDAPYCVHIAVRAYGIALTDADWSSNRARASGMRSIAIAQLGTVSEFDSKAFAVKLAELTIRRIVPISLRAAAKLVTHGADALEAAAVRCETEGTQEAAKYAAESAAMSAEYAAMSAAESAMSAAKCAMYAKCAAEYAAKCAAESAKYAMYAAEYDKVLTIAAEIGVQALRVAGAAGIKLMDRLIK